MFPIESLDRRIINPALSKSTGTQAIINMRACRNQSLKESWGTLHLFMTAATLVEKDNQYKSQQFHQLRIQSMTSSMMLG